MQNLKQLQRIVMETPVVSGFSYAFLRLLFNRLREMTEGDEGVANIFVSFEESLRSHPQEIFPEATAILNHICNQMKIAEITNPPNETKVQEVIFLLAATEDFLKIFAPPEANTGNPGDLV